jgi:hypothetical protein
MPQQKNQNMKTDFKYQLDPSPKKYRCPSCGKRRFVRYILAGTTELLPERFGRCDREVNCQYHLNPYEEKFGVDERKDWQPLPPPPAPRPPDFIPDEIMRKSFTAYRQNHFVQWLIRLVGVDAAERIANRFQIGTSKHWQGVTVFWQIDEVGHIHSGKILLYNPTTGKRIKDNQGAKIQWVHKALKFEDYNLQQCYFGLHQLSYESEKNKPIALCESEKTACIGSHYLPAFTWIATGGRNMLNVERFKPLAGLRVILFPDGDSYQDWSEKATAIAKKYQGTRITISDLIETTCSEEERRQGVDLCDLLIRLNTIPNVELEHLIRQQWQNLNPKQWITDEKRYPKMAKYNFEVLAENLNIHHGQNITPADYIKAFETLN